MPKLTNEEFLSRLPINRYYEVLEDYECSSCKIKIKDKYGEYRIRVSNLFKGALPSMVSSIDKKEFIKNKAKEVHGDKYDYSLVDYKKPNGKIKIVCKEHGIFEQHFSQHFMGAGCKKCVLENRGKEIKFKLENFIEKAKIVHKNLYGYDNSILITEENKTTIYCNIHGNFLQELQTHLLGKGCPKCGRNRIKKYLQENSISWNYSDWIEAGNKSKNFDSFKVYIIRCWNDEEEFYKIGKTFSKITYRFKSSNMPYNYTTIKQIIGEPKYICELETHLKRCNKNNSYIPKVKFKGMYECFKSIDEINI